MKSRAARAKGAIKKAGLEERVVIESDMYDADLRQATVVFDMMPEDTGDYKHLYSGNRMENGTRLVKHDLPLIGFLPDRVELPFYMMRYPFRRASTGREWAESVILKEKATTNGLWHELYYYGYEKSYDKSEIDNFMRLLRTRVKRP